MDVGEDTLKRKNDKEENQYNSLRVSKKINLTPKQISAPQNRYDKWRGLIVS